MIDIIIGILAFIFVLGIIVAIHEGGHFFFAKRVNILCREYAFGMGPLLLKKRKGETVYSIRAFPIGGFVAIAGEELEADMLRERTTVKLDIKEGIIRGIYLQVDEPSIDYPVYTLLAYDLYDRAQTGKLYMDLEDNGEAKRYPVDPQAFIYDHKTEFQIAPYNRTIGSKKKRERAMVIFGGPLMNFLLALIVFFIAGLLSGFPNLESTALSQVVEASPAAVAGLQKDDVLIKLSAGSIVVDLDEWRDIQRFFAEYKQENVSDLVEVTYLRNNEEQTTILRPRVVLWNILSASDADSDLLKIGHIEPTDSRMMNNKQLLKGDILIAVNGTDVVTWQDVMGHFEAFTGGSDIITENQMTVRVLRGDEEVDIVVSPFSKQIMENQKTLQGDPIPITRFEMGIVHTYQFHLGKSFSYSGVQTLQSATAVFGMFGLLFGDSTVTIGALSGPVGIFSITSAFAKQGFIQVLNWMGLLSVNVGLLNLLPIPALDGGRLLFIGYEVVTNKKPNPKIETALITVTMLLLFGLIIFVTFNDIFKVFR